MRTHIPPPGPAHARRGRRRRGPGGRLRQLESVGERRLRHHHGLDRRKDPHVGYSAWPGWFPLAVADKEGIFKKAGLDVKLTYFADYTSSLDALVAGQLDVNAQTLNDTMFAVASGSPQKIVVINDNSTGNDAGHL